MSRAARALLLLPALAACYAYAPPPWAATNPEARHASYDAPPGRPPAGARAPAESGEEGLQEPGARGSEGDVTVTRLRIVEKAQAFLGRRFSGDCSGFVRRVLREARIPLAPLPSAGSMSESIHRVCRPVRLPRPGDLVFFHDTYDRNRDGRLGDRWTHVALVEAVDGDRVVILHRGGKAIVRLRMNLSRPHDDAENDPIRARRRDDPPGTRYLTGELFAAYGDVVE